MALRLDFVPEPDPGQWLLGPDDDRRPDSWLPLARQALVSDWGVTDPEQVAALEDVLGLFARRDIDPFHYRALRWPALAAHPLVMHYGMFPVEERADLDAYLGLADEDLVEPALVSDFRSGDGLEGRRAVRHLATPDATVAGEYRWAWTVPRADVDIVAVCGDVNLGALAAAAPDLDTFVAGLVVKGRRWFG